MLWRPLSWFLHQILFFISIVVYLPALALEQVTQYQFFRLEEVIYGIWNNLKHLFRHICLSLWADVCQLGPILFVFVFVYMFVFVLWYHVKKVTGVNLDLACVTIFVVCVFYTTAGENDFALCSREFCDILHNSWY